MTFFLCVADHVCMFLYFDKQSLPGWWSYVHPLVCSCVLFSLCVVCAFSLCVRVCFFPCACLCTQIFLGKQKKTNKSRLSNSKNYSTNAFAVLYLHSISSETSISSKTSKEPGQRGIEPLGDDLFSVRGRSCVYVFILWRTISTRMVILRPPACVLC